MRVFRPACWRHWLVERGLLLAALLARRVKNIERPGEFLGVDADQPPGQLLPQAAVVAAGGGGATPPPQSDEWHAAGHSTSIVVPKGSGGFSVATI